MQLLIKLFVFHLLSFRRWLLPVILVDLLIAIHFYLELHREGPISVFGLNVTWFHGVQATSSGSKEQEAVNFLEKKIKNNPQLSYDETVQVRCKLSPSYSVLSVFDFVDLWQI